MSDKLIYFIRVALTVIGGFLGFKAGDAIAENKIEGHSVQAMSEAEQTEMKEDYYGIGAILGAGVGFVTASLTTPSTSGERREAKQDMYGYRWGEEI